MRLTVMMTSVLDQYLLHQLYHLRILNPGSNVTVGSPVDIEFPVTVAGTFTTVTDVNISFDITHTWIGDLTVAITSPSGTTITVMNGPCANNDDVVATFDDEATNAYDSWTCGQNPAFSGTYQPQTPLSGFDGESADGTWIVTVTDNVGGDDGTINFMNLTVAADASNGIPLPLPDGAVAVPSGDNSYVVNGFDPCGPVDLEYYDEEIDIDCTLGSGFTTLVLRHWTATDGAGNVATCSDSILLRAATLATLDLPLDPR